MARTRGVDAADDFFRQAGDKLAGFLGINQFKRNVCLTEERVCVLELCTLRMVDGGPKAASRPPLGW